MMEPATHEWIGNARVQTYKPKHDDKQPSEVRSDALSGCPWCGKTPRILPPTRGITAQYTLMCSDPACPVRPNMSARGLDRLIERWNTRATQSAGSHRQEEG